MKKISYTTNYIVKTLCVLLFSLFLAVSCEKQVEPNPEPELEQISIGTVEHGCNYDYTMVDVLIFRRDTLIISMTKDSINMFIGKNYICKDSPFPMEYVIENTLLNIFLKDVWFNDSTPGYNKCSCYYEFDLFFKRYDPSILNSYKVMLLPPLLGDPQVIFEGNFY